MEDDKKEDVAWRWELLEDEFMYVLKKHFPSRMADTNEWWRERKDDVLHYFAKGFNAHLECYGVEDIIRDAVERVLEDENAE